MPNQNTYKTHCIRGHLLSGANLYIPKNIDNRRHCRKCWVFRREKNRERIRAQPRAFYQRHREKITQRRKDTFTELIEKLKIETLTHYGNGKLACVCCGEKLLKFLTIDHIYGRRGDKKRGFHIYQNLRANNFPEGFQTLCFNCNMGRAMNFGVCPHKTIFNNIGVMICSN